MHPLRQAKNGKGRGKIGFVVAVIALLLGILLPLVAAPLGAILIWLIFTIPIYAVLAVLPTLCLIGLGALFAGRLMRMGPVPYLAGAVAVIAALVIVPYKSNPVAHDKARALIAGDMLTKPAPVRTGAIALVHPKPAGHNAARSLCGDLCRTLLLDGRAQTVLIALDDDIASGFKPDLAAIAYTLEGRATCPDTGKPAHDMPGETISTAVGQSSAERLELAVTQGRCLVARPAVAGEAKTAAIYGDIEVRRGQSARWFSDAQFTTRRIGLWQRDGAGFKETYRHTYVTYDVYFPILAPTILLEGMTSHAGFARSRQYARETDRWDEPRPADLLLGPPQMTTVPNRGTGVPPQADVTEDTRQAVIRALDSTAAPSEAELAVAKSYMDGMAWGRRELTPQDITLAARLLTDDRFPVSNAAAGVVKGNSRLSASQTSAVAQSMFARLHAMEAGLVPIKVQRGRVMDTASVPLTFQPGRFEEASAIGDVIAQLPADDILSHRSDMLWLANQKILRAPAYEALSRLDLVGGGQVFLYLIDDSGQFTGDRETAPSDDRYRQHPYLAGIKGLCALGVNATAFKPALIARIENGTVGRNGSYGDIAFNTLVAMGSPQDEMERLFKGSSNFVRVRYAGGGLSGPKRKVTTDLPMDRAYKRAQKRKDCAY